MLTTKHLLTASAAFAAFGMMAANVQAALITDFDFTDGSGNFSRVSDDAGTNWTTSDATDTVNGGHSTGGNNNPFVYGVDGVGDWAWETTFSELDATLTESVNDGDYLEFTITPDANYFLDLTSISLFVADSGNSLPEVGVRTSVDGFTDFVLQEQRDSSSAKVIDGTDDYEQFSATLDSSFTGLTDPVTFRIFGSDGGATNGSNLYRLDDIQVQGTAAIIPEPAAAALIGVGGLLMLRRRSRG